MVEWPDREIDLLLAAAFDPPEQAFDAWNQWTLIRPLDDLPDAAFGLLPAIAATLAQHPQAVPDSARLNGVRKRQWYAGRLVHKRYAAALDALRSDGIAAHLGGGFSHSQLWPRPETRPLDDALLVIDPQDSDRALVTLRAAGYDPPACAMPVWHDVVHVGDPGGEPIALSCWVLGPRVTAAPAELAWRMEMDPSDPSPADQLLMLMGRLLLSPVATARTPMWRADVRHALAAGALEDPVLRHRIDVLEIGALVSSQLSGLGVARSDFGPSGSRECEAWQRGWVRRQYFHHHARLSEAAGMRFTPLSYVRYRLHLLSHERV